MAECCVDIEEAYALWQPAAVLALKENNQVHTRRLEVRGNNCWFFQEIESGGLKMSLVVRRVNVPKS